MCASEGIERKYSSNGEHLLNERGRALKLVLERMIEITGTADLSKFPEVFSSGGRSARKIGFLSARRKIAGVAGLRKKTDLSQIPLYVLFITRSRADLPPRYVQTAGSDPSERRIDRRIYDGVR